MVQQPKVSSFCLQQSGLQGGEAWLGLGWGGEMMGILVPNGFQKLDLDNAL